MSILHGLVGSIRGFVLARIGLGLGEGGNYPAAVASVAMWFPAHERAFATSLFNAGANVGAIAAPAVVPFIALSFGWRWAFVCTGIAGLVWLLFWLPLFQRPAGSSCLVESTRTQLDGFDMHESLEWRQLLRLRQTWSFVVAKFLTDPVWWFFLIWLPDLFRKVYGMGIQDSWSKLVLIYGLVTVISVSTGWFTGHLVRVGWSTTRSRRTVLAISALCVTPVLLTTRISPWGAHCTSPWLLARIRLGPPTSIVPSPTCFLSVPWAPSSA